MDLMVQATLSELTFDGIGLTQEQMLAALRAAHAVLDQAQITPWQGAYAYWLRDQWDDSGFDEAMEPADFVMEQAHVWHEAMDAAVQACYGEDITRRGPGGLGLSETAVSTGAAQERRPCLKRQSAL